MKFLNFLWKLGTGIIGTVFMIFIFVFLARGFVYLYEGVTGRCYSGKGYTIFFSQGIGTELNVVHFNDCERVGKSGFGNREDYNDELEYAITGKDYLKIIRFIEQNSKSYAGQLEGN